MSVETRGLVRIIYIDVLDSFQGSVRAREQDPGDMGVPVGGGSMAPLFYFRLSL